MIDAQTYSLFLVTALVLVLTPGPDTVLILSRTIATGTNAGLMTLLGTQTGNVVHSMLAGLTLGAFTDNVFAATGTPQIYFEWGATQCRI